MKFLNYKDRKRILVKKNFQTCETMQNRKLVMTCELVQTVHELHQTISIGQDTLEFRLTGTCVLYCWS